jgi:hypothetical protein
MWREKASEKEKRLVNQPASAIASMLSAIDSHAAPNPHACILSKNALRERGIYATVLA